MDVEKRRLKYDRKREARRLLEETTDSIRTELQQVGGAQDTRIGLRDAIRRILRHMGEVLFHVAVRAWKTKQGEGKKSSGSQVPFDFYFWPGYESLTFGHRFLIPLDPAEEESPLGGIGFRCSLPDGRQHQDYKECPSRFYFDKFLDKHYLGPSTLKDTEEDGAEVAPFVPGSTHLWFSRNYGHLLLRGSKLLPGQLAERTNLHHVRCLAVGYPESTVQGNSREEWEGLYPSVDYVVVNLAGDSRNWGTQIGETLDSAIYKPDHESSRAWPYVSDGADSGFDDKAFPKSDRLRTRRLLYSAWLHSMFKPGCKARWLEEFGKYVDSLGCRKLADALKQLGLGATADDREELQGSLGDHPHRFWYTVLVEPGIEAGSGDESGLGSAMFVSSHPLPSSYLDLVQPWIRSTYMMIRHWEVMRQTTLGQSAVVALQDFSRELGHWLANSLTFLDTGLAKKGLTKTEADKVAKHSALWKRGIWGPIQGLNKYVVWAKGETRTRPDNRTRYLHRPQLWAARDEDNGGTNTGRLVRTPKADESIDLYVKNAWPSFYSALPLVGSQGNNGFYVRQVHCKSKPNADWPTPVLVVFPQLMELLLHCVFSNHIKHVATGAGLATEPQLCLRMGWSESNEGLNFGRRWLLVYDTGPGVPKERLRSPVDNLESRADAPDGQTNKEGRQTKTSHELTLRGTFETLLNSPSPEDPCAPTHAAYGWVQDRWEESIVGWRRKLTALEGLEETKYTDQSFPGLGFVLLSSALVGHNRYILHQNHRRPEEFFYSHPYNAIFDDKHDLLVRDLMAPLETSVAFSHVPESRQQLETVVGMSELDEALKGPDDGRAKFCIAIQQGLWRS